MTLLKRNGPLKTLNLGAATLAYEVRGKGPPLIFIHGFLARSTGDYYQRFKDLLAASYRVYFLDMRAHGGSTAPAEEVTLDHCASDIAAFAAHFQLENALLAGHSMGGFLALAAAMKDPGRFRALALITHAASKGEPNSEATVADFMAARKDAALMDQRFAGMFTASASQAQLATLRESALRLPDPVAERWMREEWPKSELTSGLASIASPVLALIGAKDVVVPPRRQYEDALLLPRAKAVTFTEHGHMLPLEKPELCAAEIVRFFRDTGTDGRAAS